MPDLIRELHLLPNRCQPNDCAVAASWSKMFTVDGSLGKIQLLLMPVLTYPIRH